VSAAQVVPSAQTGGASLSYVLHYAQSAATGESLGTWQTISPSASLKYISASERRPLSLEFSGGYNAVINGPTYNVGFFDRLLLSQTFISSKNQITLNDDVSYRPQAPITGFSGIAGSGESIGGSGSNSSPSSQTIFTLNAHVVDNSVGGSITHIVNHALSFSGSANSYLMRFPDGNGINIDGQMANATITRRIDARNSVPFQYGYARYTYQGYSYSFNTNSLQAGYTRLWNRALSTTATAGYEWIDSTLSRSSSSQSMLTAQANLSYKMRVGTAAANYTRGTSGGSGYFLGAKSDTAGASFSKPFVRGRITLGLDGGYRRQTELSSNHVIDGEYGAVQANVKCGRYLSVFANYTGFSQNANTTLPSNVQTRLLSNTSFGFTYSRGADNFSAH
jgi:hypothetical protein